LAKFKHLNFDFQLYIPVYDMLALQKIGPVTVTARSVPERQDSALAKIISVRKGRNYFVTY